jgi:hypothetical protein
MNHDSVLLASVLLLASACATSSSAGGSAPLETQSRAASAPAAADTKTASQDDKLICEVERPVGSNIPKRVCRTQAQIDREREAAQEKMRELTRPGPRDTHQ